MIVSKLVAALPIHSTFVKMITGSIIVALAISLGIVGILALFGFSIDPAIAVALAAIGAAIYAASTRR